MELAKFADLLKIGLTTGEAKIYASLLELGPSSVGPITKRAKVASSNTYEILDRLLQKGIVTSIVKNGVKYFQAVSPVHLKKYLDKKQKELDEEKKMLEQALPRIQALENNFTKQEAMLFIGIKGLSAAYKEFFKGAKKGDENLWIYMHNEEYAQQSDLFYLQNWFSFAKDIVSKGISNNDYRNSPYIKKFQKKHKMRFVDFPLFSHGEVFQDKFLLVSWETPVICVLVHAKHVSDNFRKYFYDVWKKGKS